MKILAVCSGLPERLPKKTYKTGIFKNSRQGPVMVDAHGLVGDAICNTKHHGGPDQAIYIEGGISLAWWGITLGIEMEPGAFGENLAIDGLDNRDVAAGDLFTAGDVVLQATAPRMPCATLAARMDDPGFVKRYTKAGRPGIYCRVLKSGMIEAGLIVAYKPYSGERLSMPFLMESYARRLSADEQRRHLEAPVSGRWKERVSRTPATRA
ncbi:MOSC domain-containing protein [Oryzifoliimicrobium ureilyticus]|uniref:MOSC domain-containing protein n=1 Tax=Oryzifoliimicrobium ureilyticus TaxID=3113724 RepID=UPI00307628D0